MSKEQLDNRLVVEVTGAGRKSTRTFIEQLNKAIEQGYRPTPSSWSLDDAILRSGRRKIVMYKEGYEVPKVSEAEADKRDYMAEAIAQDDVLSKQKEEVTPEPHVEVEKEEPVQEDTSVDENPLIAEIEALTKKKPLLELAERLGVDIPEEAKMPTQIKQILLDSVSK